MTEPTTIGAHRAVLDTTVLDKITAQMTPKASMIVLKYGTAMSSDAAIHAPLDTGALRNSILSESHLEAPLTYVIQDGVTYGVYQELGTSRMAAHPFILPAIYRWTDRFLSAFKDLFT